MKKRRFVRLLLAAFLAGCGQGLPRETFSPDDRPNIGVVLVDDLRFDEFHAGGHPYLETP